jgi:hypothetical protein
MDLPRRPVVCRTWAPHAYISTKRPPGGGMCSQKFRISPRGSFSNCVGVLKIMVARVAVSNVGQFLLHENPLSSPAVFQGKKTAGF